MNSAELEAGIKEVDFIFLQVKPTGKYLCTVLFCLSGKSTLLWLLFTHSYTHSHTHSDDSKGAELAIRSNLRFSVLTQGPGNQTTNPNCTHQGRGESSCNHPENVSVHFKIQQLHMRQNVRKSFSSFLLGKWYHFKNTWDILNASKCVWRRENLLQCSGRLFKIDVTYAMILDMKMYYFV